MGQRTSWKSHKRMLVGIGVGFGAIRWVSKYALRFHALVGVVRFPFGIVLGWVGLPLGWPNLLRLHTCKRGCVWGLLF